MTKPTLVLAAFLATLSLARAQEFSFPQGFIWGTATAAHQVEGGNANNDWWVWEQTPGHIKNGDRSTVACDHYNRFETDLDLARSLHTTGYRFSVEWSRIEPRDGTFDEAQIAHYRKMLEACRARGITPMVTLFHFTLPRWAAEMGGFENEQLIPKFARFAQRMAREYGSRVDLWCTLNEPMIYVGSGYLLGVFPPGKKIALLGAVRVVKNLAKAHAAARAAIVAGDRADADGDGKATKIGIAHHYAIMEPYRPDDARDTFIAKVADRLINRLFPDLLAKGRATVTMPDRTVVDVRCEEAAGTMDYLGVNYYMRNHVIYDPKAPGFFTTKVPPGTPTTDFGWEIYPEGMYRALTMAKQYGRPIYVTENGISDGSDTKRTDYLRSHLAWMARAIQGGADVRGYFHWSLLDNFEWAEGYGQRFGLFRLDYPTQARTPTRGSAFFSEVAAKNAVSLGAGPEGR